MKPNSSYAAPSLSRAFQVLDLLTKRGDWVKFGIIQKELGLAKSSTYILLNNLLQGGFLCCDRKKGYKLDLDLYILGQKALAQSVPDTLVVEAQKLVERVAEKSGANSFFGIINGNNKAAYIAKATTPLNDRLYTQIVDVGRPIPFQITGVGKALMAWRSERQVREIIAQNPPGTCSNRAILDPKEYMKHLETIRHHGITVNNQEWVSSVVTVAAPVFTQGKKTPIGGVSIASTKEKMHSGFFQKASETVYGAGKELSEKLGAADYPEYHPMLCPE